MYGRVSEVLFELEHRHNDGTWGRLERAHHDPADHDPERNWASGDIYICPVCDEQVRVRSTDPHVGSEGA